MVQDRFANQSCDCLNAIFISWLTDFMLRFARRLGLLHVNDCRIERVLDVGNVKLFDNFKAGMEILGNLVDVGFLHQSQRKSV